MPGQLFDDTVLLIINKIYYRRFPAIERGAAPRRTYKRNQFASQKKKDLYGVRKKYSLAEKGEAKQRLQCAFQIPAIGLCDFSWGEKAFEISGLLEGVGTNRARISGLLRPRRTRGQKNFR